MGKVAPMEERDLLTRRRFVSFIGDMWGLEITQRTAGGTSVFSKHPGIKVVNQYSDMWGSAAAQRGEA